MHNKKIISLVFLHMYLLFTEDAQSAPVKSKGLQPAFASVGAYIGLELARTHAKTDDIHVCSHILE